MNVVIMAAGTSGRFRTEKTKLLQMIQGKPMIRYVIENLRKAGFIEPYTLVVGHQADQIKAELGQDFNYVQQTKIIGPGQGLMDFLDSPYATDEETLVVLGDLPLLNGEEMRKLCNTASVTTKTGGLMTVRITGGHREQFMWVSFQDGKVMKVSRGKPRPGELIGDVGCYYLNTAWAKKYLPKVPAWGGQKPINGLAKLAYTQGKPMIEWRLKQPLQGLGVNTVRDMDIVREILTVL